MDPAGVLAHPSLIYQGMPYDVVLGASLKCFLSGFAQL